MSRSVQISAAEWDAMEVVWQHGPCVAAVVIEQLTRTHDWNHRTVRTLLARLVSKGALAYSAEGSRYIYRAEVSREQCVRQESRCFAERVFGGDIASLLIHFVSESNLSPEQIERLRALLDGKQSDEGEE